MLGLDRALHNSPGVEALTRSVATFKVQELQGLVTKCSCRSSAVLELHVTGGASDVHVKFTEVQSFG